MSASKLRNLPRNTGMQDGLVLNTAVVGGGVSGLYTAWRLVSGAGPNLPLPGNLVGVFEMSDRIGGRLESVFLPGMYIAGELGGMRYMTSQAIVTTLIETVFAADWLQHVDFPMGDPAHLIVYLRKQRLAANAWTEAQRAHQVQVTNYQLNQADVGFDADQLFNKVVYDVLMADPWFVTNYGAKVGKQGLYDYTFELTSQDWDVVKPALTYGFAGPYQGRKVNDLGFWNVIKDRVSQEGYEFLADAGGYFSNTINWNAAEAFPYMVGDFSSASTAYRTITNGYDLIALAIALGFLQAPGSNVWIQNQLLTFDYAPGGPARYRLVFMNLQSGTRWTVFADNIVLAMPRRSLELLDQDNFFFQSFASASLRQNMASVIVEPSFKILMGFEEPWWRQDLQADSGHSITDLPMRQCYYFGTDPQDSHSLFLASYNDMDTVPFWSVLADDPERFTPRPTARVSLADLSAVAGDQASALMVGEVMQQVRELHGNPNIPAPYVTYYKDWSLDPYGGGYHAWKAGVNVQNAMKFMRRPNQQEAVFVCGEAYSDQQGWVEGALCVAERMLQEHFGMTWPSWLDSSYYLGW